MTKKTHRVDIKSKETDEVVQEGRPVTEVEADWAKITTNVMIDHSRYYVEIGEIK